ncbi:MAG TPA: L,D-transpeptidase [Patescibacteria group bacterium]|nr:L,D-transpeptidase [Patescibacteria group bacterium]
MPKKAKKEPSHWHMHALRLTFIIVSSFLLFVFGFTYLQIQVHQPPPCANSESCINDLSGTYNDDTQGIFMGREITSPLPSTNPFLAFTQPQAVLAETNPDNKRIYVDLTNQKLFAYEGDKRVFEFDVSTGKWGRTPTGNFRIWIWLRYTRMSGGSGATYYNLPNVPYTMFFYNDAIPKARGYALHGAYWHNNFGHPMSHGCVNLRIDDAEKLFSWTNPSAQGTTYPTEDNPGTLITIYGEAPNE